MNTARCHAIKHDQLPTIKAALTSLMSRDIEQQVAHNSDALRHYFSCKTIAGREYTQLKSRLRTKATEDMEATDMDAEEEPDHCGEPRHKSNDWACSCLNLSLHV